jgi:hypothetical protein
MSTTLLRVVGETEGGNYISSAVTVKQLWRRLYRSEGWSKGGSSAKLDDASIQGVLFYIWSKPIEMQMKNTWSFLF